MKSSYNNEETLNLIIELSYVLFNPGLKNKAFDPRVKCALGIIERTPEKRISSKELAYSVCLSESRFAHLFKDDTGITIRKYLLWSKLRKAIKLILYGGSYTEAAYESGFSDSAHFSRTYRQMFGVSPSQLLNSCNSNTLLFK